MLDFVGLRAPRLTSIENCMKLSQMVVQGLQEAKSPLLQLPHFEEEHLRYCISKKVHLSQRRCSSQKDPLKQLCLIPLLLCKNCFQIF